MMNAREHSRVLAIDPTSKGFGFVVVEGRPVELVDWGVVQVELPRNAKSLERIRSLVGWYLPMVVVTEDATPGASRRRQRVRALLDDIARLPTDTGVPVKPISCTQVREAFREYKARTEYEIAAAVALDFPELGNRLPPPRKIWMSEDSRMALFGAAALALTYFRAPGRDAIERQQTLL